MYVTDTVLWASRYRSWPLSFMNGYGKDNGSGQSWRAMNECSKNGDVNVDKTKD